jgi:hypothetical protein
MSDATISKEAFAVLLDRAGLTKLDAQQVDDLCAAYKHVQQMAARVRTPRGREAEPAHIFVMPREASA